MSPCITVTAVKPLERFRLELTFSDGLRAVVDLRDRIAGRGGLFTALEDPAFFRQVRVHPELGTVVWPNELDICPDLLHDLATGIVSAPLPQKATA